MRAVFGKKVMYKGIDNMGIWLYSRYGLTREDMGVGIEGIRREGSEVWFH